MVGLGLANLQGKSPKNAPNLAVHLRRVHLAFPPEILALKHESGILGQWSNRVSGSWKSQVSSLWAKQHTV